MTAYPRVQTIYAAYFDILLRFRSYPVALVADIEKAFHQILIHASSDRDVLKFLWFEVADQNQ